jgi:uncharacterized protein (DUF433 family)
MTDWRAHIEIDPAVMMGKPVIKGTRVTVEQLVRESARGAGPEAIAALYPRIKPEDVRAALLYAADYLAHEVSVAAE